MCMCVYNHSQLHLCDMGKGHCKLLVRKSMCAYKEHYHDANVQSIDICFSRLWGELIHQSAPCWRYFR